MSQTFQYDPLEILNRAEKSADDWWTSTVGCCRFHGHLVKV
jgi:hypothetical protein